MSIPKKLDYGPLDAEKFKRRTEALFPSSYMTTIGIIQSVALGILAYQVFATPTVGLNSLSSVWTDRGLELAYAFASFFAVLLVIFEYSWFVLLFRPSITFVDILVPYVLGASEFAPLFFISKLPHGYWWAGNSIFAFCGVFAYVHAFKNAKREIFAAGKTGDIVCNLIKQNIQKGLVVVASLLVLELIVYHFFDHIPVIGLMAMAVGTGFLEIWNILESAKYLVTVEDAFAQQSTA